MDRRPFHRDPLATYDALGRKQPKQVGFMEVLRGAPWLLGAFDREVPSEHWSKASGVERGEAMASVDCPCGSNPVVAFNVPMLCKGGCRRWFFFDGARIRVAREPEPARSLN